MASLESSEVFPQTDEGSIKSKTHLADWVIKSPKLRLKIIEGIDVKLSSLSSVTFTMDSQTIKRRLLSHLFCPIKKSIL